MTSVLANQRNFLFLQGPPGPFFFLLGQSLIEHGASVYRINVCGGDRYDWEEGAIDYRGRQKNWPLFFNRFVRDHQITDLVLYGDCRPMHRAALHIAQLRGIHIHVFEEGYIRPDWMTLERDGVNGHSPFERDPAIIMAAAEWLPPVPKLPPITSSFGRRARDSYWHYHHVVTGKLRFPFYRSHRQGSITLDGIGWILRFFRKRRRAELAARTLREIKGHKYFLFTLQLSGDYQIRAHSPFSSMRMAAEYVLESFAQYAPDDCILLVKEHPFDSSFRSWPNFLRRTAKKLGVENRVHHIDGGDLKKLSEHSSGMICVNSTSGTLGLEVGIPVIVLGDAVYDVPGVTHQGGLDGFWSAPETPNRKLYEAFKKVLHARCLVRGGYASESATRILLHNSLNRLLSENPISRVPVAALANRQEDGSKPESSR